MTVRCRPDVVLMNVRMPAMDGLSAAAEIAAMPAAPKVVMLAPTVTRRLIGYFADNGPSRSAAARARLAVLTRRELEVVRGVRTGCPTWRSAARSS